MQLVVPWLVFPLLLLVIAHGCGTVVERLARLRLGPALRLPTGSAAMVVVLDLFTRTRPTAPLAVPALVAMALIGLVLAVSPWPPHRSADRPWPPRVRRPTSALWLGLAVFLAFGAPVLLSGQATFPGYIKLDDSSTWMAFADSLPVRGHTVAGLPEATLSALLSINLGPGYPVGAFLPMAVGHTLLDQDVAWLEAPVMAWMAAMLALSLQAILARLPVGRAWRELAAFLAAQPALLYGYVLWGGMKEVAGAALLAAFGAAGTLPFDQPAGTRGRRRWRAGIPAAVAVLAVVSALSVGGLVWILPGAAAAAVLFVLRSGRRPALPSRGTLIAAALLAGLVAFVLLRPGSYIRRFAGALRSGTVLGNLGHPLNGLQVFGIWPAGDFRETPSALTVTHVLIAVVLLGTLLGLVLGVLDRQRRVVLYELCAAGGALIVGLLGSPWLVGKALATAAPGMLLGALAGAGLLAARGRRLEGAAITAAIAAGVLWSNLFAYHDVSLAPRAQLAELARIGHSLAGQGPTLMTEYNPYGDRHFLRDAGGEGAPELRTRLDPLLDGAQETQLSFQPIDEFDPAGVLAYRSIVLRRSPVEARPPAPYELRSSGRFYTVWQRPPSGFPSILAAAALGDPLHQGSVPSCGRVRALARTPGAVELAAAAASEPRTVALAAGAHPATWTSSSGSLTPDVPGAARVRIAVPAAGRWTLWLGGSVRGPARVRVGTHDLGGTIRNALEAAGQYVEVGTLALPAGAQTVEVRYLGEDLHPGSGGPQSPIGPVMLSADRPPPPLLRVTPRDAGELCGRDLQWIEVLGAPSAASR